jgi:hypothetical protein
MRGVARLVFGAWIVSSGCGADGASDPANVGAGTFADTAVSRPKSPADAAALKSLLTSVAARTAEAALTCTYARDGAPQSGPYRLVVEDVSDYGGVSDAMVRFVTTTIDDGTQSMLVTYIPSVSPTLVRTDASDETTYEYAFQGFFEDVLDASAGADGRTRLSFQKRRGASDIFEIACDPY